MANIKIHNLNPTGSELFGDSETFLNELGEAELNSVEGGTSITWTVTVTRSYTYTWTRTWNWRTRRG
jgi:hypothetical protein